MPEPRRNTGRKASPPTSGKQSTRDFYLKEFERRARKGSEPSSIARLRKEAIQRFAELDFPTTRHEEWKYTSVAPIAATPFREGGKPGKNGKLAALLGELTFGELECTHLVFVNGRYAPALSQLRPLPKGARISSLAALRKEDPEQMERHLGRHLSLEDAAFAALNTALFTDGAFVHIPKGLVLDEPIHLLYLTTPDGEPVGSHPRNLIVAEEGSQAVILESYATLGGGSAFTNAVTELAGGDGAVLHHCKIQRESDSSYHVATLQVHLTRDANLTSHNVTLGGALTRNDINAVLDAEGVHCALNGIYLAHGSQHVDNHTFIDHAKPHCASREIYKGVLADRSHGVFNGKIRVRKDAQKTDAKQTNKNLLLSEEALVDTKPQLEIYADDVKCTHGATIGQLDEDSLFYLRSRGIDVESARSILIHAFASDLIERIPVAPVRTGLECLLMTRLPMGIEARRHA
jgi:Fe-S cluster assembly protein SufD